MLHLGSTYFIVKNMERSLALYEAFCGTKASSGNLNRWAEFHIGSPYPIHPDTLFRF